jgi:hypothetical protein
MNPFGHSGRRFGDFYAGLVGDLQTTQKWKRLRRPKRGFHASRRQQVVYLTSGKPGASMRVMQTGFLMCCAAIHSSACR